MDRPPNPFSLFDFLGYFFPGAITVYSALLSYGHVSTSYRVADALKEVFSLTKPENILPFVLASYVIGHFLSYVSSITVEKYLYWQYGFPSKFLLGLPYKPYFPGRVGLSFLDVVKLGVILFLFPIFIFDQLIGTLFRMSGFYAKSLDRLSKDIIGNKAWNILVESGGVEPDKKRHPPTDVDYFQYLYHYALEHAPNHGPKMQNYVALYGFLRTLTLISLFYFWIGIWHVWFSRLSAEYAIPLVLLLAAVVFVFFLAYFKFLRRYSLEVLMAAAVAYREPARSA